MPDPLVDWRIVNNSAVSVLKGERLGKSDFAYTPSDHPSQWKLRIDDARHVAGAIAALGKGFRGSKVQIPSDDLAGVKRKVLKAWEKYHKGEDPPAVLNSVLNARRRDDEDDDDDEEEEDEDMTKNNEDDEEEESTENNDSALQHSNQAMECSGQCDDNPDGTVTAHEATMLAHKMPSSEAHIRAAEEHETAARRHDDLSKLHPHDARHHKKAAHHHRKASEAHEDQADMTSTHDNNPTHNRRRLHHLSDADLDMQHKEILAEKNKREMDNFMGLTYHNPAEETQASQEAEGLAQQNPEDVDWDAIEFNDPGLGGSHNDQLGGEMFSHNVNSIFNPTMNQQTLTANRDAWFNNAPPDVQEAMRDAINIQNRERGALLQQLTANMSEENKNYAINRYKGVPMQELRQMVSMFAPTFNQAGPPPIQPIFSGAVGGANFVGNQQMGEDAMMLPPTTNWNEVAEANRGK